MKLSSFESIVHALNAAGVRYLVVGGVAVNAHGYIRTTRDVDLVVQLTEGNVRAAFLALESIGYRPAQPVAAEEFADSTIRRAWRRDKGMVVLKLWSDAHRDTPLDVFVEEPFDFDTEYDRSYRDTGEGSIPARFASIPTLIAMKRRAGRPQDLIDVEKLSQIDRLLNDGE